MMIEVLVNGANGKMGQETVNAIQSQDDMQLVGQSDIDNDLAQMIAQTKPKVVVDFTNPASVKSNILTIIAGDARPVIGTTGLTDTDIEEIREIAKAQSRDYYLPKFCDRCHFDDEVCSRCSKVYAKC